MRDYKLRKRVFNEYPTTAEVQKMIAQGGGGSGTPEIYHISFDVVKDTPYTLTEDDADLFASYSLTADYYINNEQFFYYSTRIDGQNIIFEFYDEDGENLIFSADNTFTTITATSSISGTVKMFLNFNKNVSLNATYHDGTITISEPYSVIHKLIEVTNNGALVVHIADGTVFAIGYLTITETHIGGLLAINIYCDIDIQGKFNFTVDANDQIIGRHGTA